MNEIEEILAKIDEGAARGNSAMVAAKARYLSQESETGPFLLFLMGDSLEVIADKTKIPKEVLAVSARQHNWVSRKQAFAHSGTSVPAQIQKNLVNTILATTYIAVKEELAMVMKGERDPAQCKFIPKNISALAQLIDLVKTVNSLETDKAPLPPIKGDNVQVNINMGDSPASKADLLKKIAEQNESGGRSDE